MIKVLYKFLFVGVLCISLNSNAQNKDIEWLREIHIERNTSLDPAFHFFDKSLMPVMIGAPITVLGIGLIKKDSTITRKGLFMLGTVCVNSAITLGLKYAINRERPFVTYSDIQNISGEISITGSKSFPSGHTSGAFSTATSLTIAFPKWYVAAPSFIWASAVGYGRMHLGVHYPSDIIVGAIVGTGSAMVCHWLNEKIHWEKKRGWFL